MEIYEKEIFKQRLNYLKKKESIIKHYQSELEACHLFTERLSNLSNELLETVRAFSLRLLPEIKRRQDFDFGKNLQFSWESLKSATLTAQQAQTDVKVFEEKLAKDLARVRVLIDKLIAKSGYTPSQLTSIYKEMATEVQAQGGEDGEQG